MKKALLPVGQGPTAIYTDFFDMEDYGVEKPVSIMTVNDTGYVHILSFVEYWTCFRGLIDKIAYIREV